jgi:hypothetical protein
MAQNFRVNESRNTLWIGIALVTAAAVVILALAAQDVPGTGGRSNQAEGSIATTEPAATLGTDSSEYVSIPGTATSAGVAEELNPPFQSSVPWSPAPSRALVPETQVGADQFMPHPPFEAPAASVPERATDPVVWMPHPP